jgi:protein-tyrosine phosphatase
VSSIVDRIRSQLAGRGKLRPQDTASEYSVLFVCMGNICRSPTVEGVFRQAVLRELPDRLIGIDSAGTHAYHIGQPPDSRAQRAALRRGVDLSGLRARRIVEADFSSFDLVLAMDSLNVAVMEEICPPEYRQRIRLLLQFASSVDREDVPDPYYGGSKGFEYVLDLAEEASAGLIAHLKSTLARP